MNERKVPFNFFLQAELGQTTVRAISSISKENMDCYGQHNTCDPVATYSGSMNYTRERHFDPLTSFPNKGKIKKL